MRENSINRSTVPAFDIFTERMRQKEKHGYTVSQDLLYQKFELQKAAEAFLLLSRGELAWAESTWPFSEGSQRFAGVSERDALVKAAALILARLEVIDSLRDSSVDPGDIVFPIIARLKRRVQLPIDGRPPQETSVGIYLVSSVPRNPDLSPEAQEAVRQAGQIYQLYMLLTRVPAEATWVFFDYVKPGELQDFIDNRLSAEEISQLPPVPAAAMPRQNAPRFLDPEPDFPRPQRPRTFARDRDMIMLFEQLQQFIERRFHQYLGAAKEAKKAAPDGVNTSAPAPMTGAAMDASVEKARSLHRIVRALHDGHCPVCSAIFSSSEAFDRRGESCPRCGFYISGEEANAAVLEFQPIMDRSLELFERWRAERDGRDPDAAIKALAAMRIGVVAREVAGKSPGRSYPGLWESKS